MPLSPDDYTLSMKIGQRARRPGHNDGLRSLLVHRLSDTFKLIIRRSLRTEQLGWFCEDCDEWVQHESPPDTMPARLQCPQCGRMYRLETAVYEEIEVKPSDATEGSGS